jgi:hypothetical protein
VLLWINGPFGGGKTQAAYELQRRLPGSVVCDPEQVGYGLHRMMPRELRRDFQDLPSWRQGVYEVLDRVLTEYDGDVIAPMTLAEPRYFDDIVGRLRERGHDVLHTALLARRDTVVRRLRERGINRALQWTIGDHPLRRESFALAKLDWCLEQLAQPRFAEHLWTDDVTVAQVADRIAASAGLTLRPNTDGNLRGCLRRSWVSVKHIRL